MSKFCFQYISNYYKTYILKIVIIYITLGVLIFSFSNLKLPYINMIYYIVGHPYLISFFIIPITLFTSIDLIKKLNTEKSFLIRFNNRNQLFNQYLKIIVINCLYINLIFLFITMLFTNILSDRSNFLLDDPYYTGVNNLTVLISIILKLYIFMIFIVVLHLFSKNKLSTFLVVLYDIFLLISFMGYMPKVIDFVLPSNYLGYHYITSSFIESLIKSFICLILNTILFIYLYRENIFRKDIL